METRLLEAFGAHRLPAPPEPPVRRIAALLLATAPALSVKVIFKK